MMQSKGWIFPLVSLTLLALLAFGAEALVLPSSNSLIAQEEEKKQEEKKQEEKKQEEKKQEEKKQENGKQEKEQQEEKKQSKGSDKEKPKSDEQDKSDDAPEDKSGQDADGTKDDSKNDADKDKSTKKKSKENGTQDLNKAFDLKLEYRTTKDLDKITKLCEIALKKGLNEKETAQAKKLAATCSFDFADQLAQRIFIVGDLDKRWQFYRAQALPRLKKAIKFDESMVNAYVLLAKMQALPGGDRDKAREAVAKVLELATDDVEQRSAALFVRASLTKDKKERLNDLNKALKINPRNLDALKVRAMYYVGQENAKLALADYKVWLEEQPENYQARVVAVEALLQAGESFDEEVQSEAIAILDEAIKLKSDFTVPYTFKAQIYDIAENSKEVVKAADLALKYEPKNVKALELRANALSNLGMYEKAVDDAEKMIQLQGLSLEGVQLRGIIRIRQGNYAKAVKDFETLSSANPNNLELKRQLANLYNANDEPTKAIKIYSSLLRRVRKSVWRDKAPEIQVQIMAERITLLQGRADASLSIGEHEDAVEDYDEAIELNEQVMLIQEKNEWDVTFIDEGILNNLAWVLATSTDDGVRDGKRAIEMATRAAEMTDFKEAFILSTLASGHAEAGDFDKAVELVEQALKINREMAEEAVDKADTDRQFKSLNKELESYKKKEAWREMQNVEEEKKEAETKESDDEK